MSTGLEILNPQTIKVSVGGRELVVTPIKMKHLQAFAKAVQPVANDLIEVMNGDGDFVALVAANADKLIDAVAIGSGASVDDIGDLNADDFVQLATAVVSVNTDFFVRNLLPGVRAAIDQMKSSVQQAATAGAMHSKP